MSFAALPACHWCSAIDRRRIRHKVEAALRAFPGVPPVPDRMTRRSRIAAGSSQERRRPPPRGPIQFREPGEGQVHQAGLDERHRPDGEAMLGRPCRLAAGTMAEAANSTMRFDLL